MWIFIYFVCTTAIEAEIAAQTGIKSQNQFKQILE